MLYIIIIFCIIVIFYTINLYENNYENYNKIPYILYKTGPYDLPTNELEEIFKYNKMKLYISKIFYYNDNECYDLIKTMGTNVLKAYDSLIPNAYKADLWRYCVLYKYGGIYGDLTQKFLLEYDVNMSNVDMVLVRDINDYAIQISFIATKPNNIFLKYVIDNISNDILAKKKGKSSLDVTGPIAFCRYFLKFFKINKIPEGVNNLKGIDNNNYKIRIDLRQIRGLVFQNVHNKKITASTKTSDHNETLVNVTKKPKYYIDWKNNNIFK